MKIKNKAFVARGHEVPANAFYEYRQITDIGAAGALFQGRQLGLALVQAIADQHQLLQALRGKDKGCTREGQSLCIAMLPRVQPATARGKPMA